MADPREVYDLLLDYAISAARVEEVFIGLVWTLCRGEGIGLAMSPALPTRTLDWPGTLRGQKLAELTGWVRDWEPYKAAVGMAAVNAAINAHSPLPEGEVLSPESPATANLAVFDHFLPKLKGQRIAIVGRYPGFERYQEDFHLTVLERQPAQGDLPDPACEYVLPRADWVFLTASSLPNKTFPRLAELSRNAKTVLMGPTVPWLPELHEFGIDYLAGIQIEHPDSLRQTIAEGGGVKIFATGVRYRVVELTPTRRLAWLRQTIAQAAAQKERLTQEMSRWYEQKTLPRFPRYEQLEALNQRLSRLDSSFKRLWDSHQTD